MYLFKSEKLDDFDFGCRRFRTLLQRQRARVDDGNWTVLVYLCSHNSHLLRYDWAVELVQRLNGKFDTRGLTALIWLFERNSYKTDFSTNGFKLLWEEEKGINADVLKESMR